MYLFLDTETADLPRRWDAPAADIRNWPRLVQLAWITCDADGAPAAPQKRLIKPEGFVITHGAFLQHGISTEYAKANGAPLQPVLDEFREVVRSAKVVVGHNVDFDANVAGAEFLRAGMPNALSRKTLRCTMKESTEYCRLPGKHGYKWPTLTELHRKLFDEPFEHAHDAAADCMACMRCFFRLEEINAGARPGRGAGWRG
jgi:DNA polymerase III epsilon subunit-like protein